MTYNQRELKPQLAGMVMERYHGYCVYCFRKCISTSKLPTDGRRISIDHKVPRSRNGQNTISNLVVACMRCNRRKNALTHQEFRIKMKLSVYQHQFKLKLRRKAVELHKKGLSTREISLIVGKSHQWVARVVRQELSVH